MRNRLLVEMWQHFTSSLLEDTISKDGNKNMLTSSRGDIAEYIIGSGNNHRMENALCLKT